VSGRVRSLAMVAEVVHGAPWRFADPARFSDETIRVLKTAVAKARLGRDRLPMAARDELATLRRLDDQARRLESELNAGSRAP
jgi:uncharacterized protein